MPYHIFIKLKDWYNKILYAVNSEKWYPNSYNIAMLRFGLILW